MIVLSMYNQVKIVYNKYNESGRGREEVLSMIIEKVTSREGYRGVMMTNYTDSGIPLFVIFVWGKEDGTDNYVTLTNSIRTEKYEYDSFKDAMLDAIELANRR